MCTYADLIILCGDINARVGRENYCIPEIDSLLERNILHRQKNSHGKSCIKFLKYSKFCIVNGRVKPQCDNYTFVSRRGKSVVDYFCIPHDCLKFCVYFKVIAMSNIIGKYQYVVL